MSCSCRRRLGDIRESWRCSLERDWMLKEESIGPPSKYWGGKLRDGTLLNGVKVEHLAYTNLSKPDQACTRPVRKGLKLLYKAPNPLSTDYRLLSKDWRNARVRGGWCLVLKLVDWCATMDCGIGSYWYWGRSEHVIRCCIEHGPQTQA